MPENAEIQLLPQTRKKVEIKIPGQNKLLFFALGFLVLLGGFYSGLAYYKNLLDEKLSLAEQGLVDLEKSRNKENEDKILALQDRLRIIRPMISSHIFWSAGLAKLQNLTSPQVQIDSLSVNLDKKEFNFKAFTPNYTTLAKQISAFYADDLITDVTLGKVISLPTGKLEFNMQINFDVNKLLKKNLPKR